MSSQDYGQDYPGANGHGYSGRGDGDGGSYKRKTDDDDRKIFVGGLSWESSVKDIKEHFSKFGEVVDCTLKTDLTTGRSRGFAFVTFADKTSVDDVLNEKSHILHGRNIDPKRAQTKPGKEPMKKVFVGGLDINLSEDEIRTYFNKYGKIDELILPIDKTTQKRKGFAFITFESEEVADRVVENPRQTIGSREAELKKALPKDQLDNRGGFGGRGGRGGRGGYQATSTPGAYDYSSYYGSAAGYPGYDYSGYGAGYGSTSASYPGYSSAGYSAPATGYDYSSYYQQQSAAPAASSYGSGYGGGYDYSSWPTSQQAPAGGDTSYKAKRGAPAAAGYHPYAR